MDRILLDIVCILSKFVNFRVAKCVETMTYFIKIETVVTKGYHN